MKIKKYILALFILTSLNSQAAPFAGNHMVFTSVSEPAVNAAKEIAKQGGNVVDAAVVIGLVLAVTHPHFAALGGGGFALVKIKGKPIEVLDYREKAPLNTTPEFYINKPPKSSFTGGSAVAVPGVVAGLWALHKRYGKLSWKKLFSRAIKLAHNGFHVSRELNARSIKTKPRFNKAGLKYFFKSNGEAYKPGEIIKQKNLAQVLRKIKARGPKGFYSGSVAKDIVRSVKNNKGVMTLRDLDQYKVRWLKPLKTDFEGHTIYLMPPPSSGGIIIKSALKLTQKLNIKKMKALSINELHYFGEILSRSFRGRALLGDPDFHKNPNFITSDKYLTKMAKSIYKNKTKKLKPLVEKRKTSESNETTHYSVLDKDGNAVSITVTMNANFGSGVVSKKYGIVLNNEMDDFTTNPNKPNSFGLVQGYGNRIQPGKRPLSSMSPTLVVKNNKVIMAIGAPGGPRIISTVFQILYRVLVSGYNIDDAIQAPRVHHQFLPHTLFVDKGYRMPPALIKGLKKKGHNVKQSWNARGYGIILKENGILEAGFDSRGEGSVAGY